MRHNFHSGPANDEEEKREKTAEEEEDEKKTKQGAYNHSGPYGLGYQMAPWEICISIGCGFFFIS